MKKLALPDWSRHFLMFAAYAPLHWLLLRPANVIWHPPAGLRFAFLLLLPLRWWVPMALWLYAWYDMVDGTPWPSPVEMVATFIGTGCGALLLKLRGKPEHDDSAAMTWLLVAMLFSSAGNALKLVLFREPWNIDVAASELFPHLLLGDYIGMLTITPLILMSLELPPRTEHFQRWRFDLPIVLLPVLGLSAWLLVAVPGDRGYQLAAGLALPMAIYFAFRSGWRGVSLLLSSVSLLIGLVAWRRNDLPSTLEGQLFLALAGSTLLLLGVAAESLRDHQNALRQRNRELQSMANELREAARRNLNLSEDVRRWITAELHDEVGQNLTALQTRLMLVERRSRDKETLQPAWDIIDRMRGAVSGLMSGLRPASLDELGLRQTLERGQIRATVEQNGLRFDLRIDDEDNVLDALGNPVQTALYRIVQEAATNALRHANARTFRVLLRGKADGRIALYVADDGGGILPHKTRKPGMGLQGIRDRVLALGGRLRLRSDDRGTRLLVRLRDS